MTKSRAGKRSNPIWNIFRSVKLTIILLIIMAITSILGTVIPQQEGAIEFAQKLSPGMKEVFSTLQFFDMYHSVWFRVIIFTLLLNLIVCSIDRFSSTLKLFQTLPRPDRSKPFENLPPDRIFSIDGDIEGMADRVAILLKGQYKNVERKHTEKGDFFYAEKGRYSLFGVYLVHLSVLLILSGAIAGSILGFEAYVNIVEGEEVDAVTLRKNGAPHSLGFSVHCKKFTVDFYKDGAPKEYRSDLIFLHDGKELRNENLLVNHPVTFRGITFYQSSYGTVPGDKARLKIFKNGADPVSLNLELKSGKPVRLPGNDGQFMVAKIREDFMRMGPAILIVIRPQEGDEISFWIFQHQEMLKERFPEIFEKFPKLNPASYKPYTFFLDDIESRYYTGLQVNRDPGVPLVWIGFFMIVTGCFIAFFMSHKRFWVRILKTKGKIEISVAGRSNKNPVGMDREMEQLAHKIRNLFTE